MVTITILVALLLIYIVITIGGAINRNEAQTTFGFVGTAIFGVALLIIGVVYLVCWLVLITNAAIITVNG